MATYRLSVSTASRAGGRSGTAMAAYRAGEKMEDRRTGQVFDYERKQGVQHAEIFLPEGAPDWASDRAELWNRSEAAHRRSAAIVAREIQVSLPHELNDEQRRELTGEFARFLCDRYGVAVDACIHAPHRDGDDRNHHAHLMICTRHFDASKREGLGNNVREFDAVSCQRSGTKNHVEEWRETWQQQLNKALERAEVRGEDGAIVQLDHRSYERQGSDQEPQIKEGPAATAMERRGEASDRVAMNEAIKERNEERQRMAAEIDAPELLRRQAQQITEQQARELLPAEGTEAPDLAARQAQHMTAPEVARELTPANDNDPSQEVTARRAETLTPEQIEAALTRFERMPWETEEQHRESAIQAAERAAERERAEREREREGPAREWGFSR